MQISTESWHYRVFNWYYKQKKHYPYQEWGGHTINLCPYIRTVLLWSPLVFCFYPPRLYFTGSVLLGALTGANYHYWGKLGLFKELAVFTILAGAGAILGLALLLAIVIEKLDNWQLDRMLGHRKESTFLNLLSERIKSVYKGICPMVHIVDPAAEQRNKVQQQPSE